ncbi:Death on curing protein, Doc toxin [Euzebya pacifica]|uniref:Death on curing protein, Doc toxin n=1 Tax=Euzebya pacifica TaxID=1608957 RepID=A0A346XUL0_9ACTN|nr:Fic family protein [Euzebya pacifica]AXV05907.1 Death on curing protein, Doc toxin [Euzebya pacifica]
MDGPVVHLTLDDFLHMVRRLGIGPVRDLGLIDAAVARPRSTAYGTDAYPTLGLKAAALLELLVGNHALVDGNKRIAWLATVVSLDLNGVMVTLDDDAAFDLVMDAAQRRLPLEAIANRLVPDVEPDTRQD